MISPVLRERLAVEQTHAIVRAMMAHDLRYLRDEGRLVARYAALFRTLYPVVADLHDQVVGT